MRCRIPALALCLGVLVLLLPTVLAAGFFPDFNSDGSITVDDLSYFVHQFQLMRQGKSWAPACDLAWDGSLTRGDAVLMIQAYLTNPPTPGRYFAYQSNADAAVHLYDRVADSPITLTAIGAGGYHPAVTPGGRFIVLTSGRAGGAGGFDVYLYDRNSSSLVGLPGLNSSANDEDPSISADGRYITFDSDRSGGAGGYDVYLYDRLAGALVSLPGISSSAQDYLGSISGDGRYIVLMSYRPGGPGNVNIYLYDRTTNSATMPSGLNFASANAWPCISADSRFIAFESYAGPDPVDICLYDRGTSAVLSTPGLNFSGANNRSPSISSDDRYLAFRSDQSGSWASYVYDRTTSSLVTNHSSTTLTVAGEYPWLN